jgi:hypothetical protein
MESDIDIIEQRLSADRYAPAEAERYLENFLTTYALIMHINAYNNRRII